MKANLTALLLMLTVSGCAIQPTSIKTPDGQQLYTFTCSTGIEQCEQSAATWCAAGYDVIEHSTHISRVVPHYGEYPVTLISDNLTVKCK
jgi:hypothetical protein